MPGPKYQDDKEVVVRKWVGERLRWARKRAWLFGYEVAETMERTPRWVENIEGGRSNIYMVDFIRLCSIYSKTPDEILNALPLDEEEDKAWRIFAHSRKDHSHGMAILQGSWAPIAIP